MFRATKSLVLTLFLTVLCIPPDVRCQQQPPQNFGIRPQTIVEVIQGKAIGLNGAVSSQSGTTQRNKNGIILGQYPYQRSSPPLLEPPNRQQRSPAAILPLGQDIRAVLAASAPVRSHRPSYGSRDEARSRADYANPLPAAHSLSAEEPDPRFVNRNFVRRPPQRYSHPVSADHLVDEDPAMTPTAPAPVEVAAPARPVTSLPSPSSAPSSHSNARRYPNYLRNADAFDRDTARRQLADQRRTELRMQEEERIKDETKRLEDEKREEERIRLENDRRLAEEERARNDRRETEGLRLEAEMNEKRDGMLRQQERAKDKIQTAKEDTDRILEAYTPIQNGRRPIDPEDHIDPGHYDPGRGVFDKLVPVTAAPRFVNAGRVAMAQAALASSMSTMTTATTATTTTTPAPTPAPASAAPIRPAGRPGGRRFIGRHRVKSENDRPPLYKPTPPSTSTTAAAAPADYEDEYEDEYDYATTTTRRPKRRRNRKRTSTTTTTTTTTLSPGYKERADGRIIDFAADPNFPYELKGADLTDYPFYVKVPEKVQFDCKGRHDGYYANVDLYCQIYHHCAIGYRYDFLCPNYTLFDQTTFTCRFINTVNCGKSANFYKRNEDLYVESTTTAPQESRRNSEQESGRLKKKRNRNGSNTSNNRDENSGSTNNNNNNNNSNRSRNRNRNDSSSSSSSNSGNNNSDNTNNDNNNNGGSGGDGNSNSNASNNNNNNNSNNSGSSSNNNKASNSDNKSGDEKNKDGKDGDGGGGDEEYDESRS